MRLSHNCLNIRMERKLMNTENRKASKTHKFFLCFLQRLDLRNSNKQVSLQNLSF